MKTEDPPTIAIPADIAAKCDGPGQFERFDSLFRAVIAVPKKTIDKRERAWKRQQEKKRAKRTA
jgi:hypothetical protein